MNDRLIKDKEGVSKTEGNIHKNTKESKVEVFAQNFNEDKITKKPINDERRFALNTKTADELIGNGKLNLRELDINENLIANTLESYKCRILSNSHDITNDIVQQSNYEYFLFNSDKIGENLAKLIIAKAEKDRDLEKSLSDILDPNGKYSNMPPEAVVNEVYNRLKERNLYNVPELKTMMKILQSIKQIEDKEDNYQKTINSKRDEVISKLLNGYAGELFNNIDIDKPLPLEYESILINIDKLFEKVPPYSDEKFINYLQRADVNSEVEDLKDDLVLLIEVSEDVNYLYQMNTKELQEKVERALGFFSEIDKDNFYKKDKEFKEKANYVATSLVLENNESPRSILLSLIDNDIYKDLDTKEYINHISGKLNISEDESRAIFEETRNILLDNKNIVEGVVIPDDQEKHNPLLFTLADKKNDTSLKLLENAMALAIFKNQDNELFNMVYTKEAQQVLLEKISDPSIIKRRASIDEVNDVFNSYLLLKKAATSEIDTNDIDNITKNVFKNSSILNKEDIKNLNKASKDLSKDAQKIFADIKAGVPSQDELSFAIQELAYLDVANKQADKLKFSKNNIGRFFRNNRAIHRFAKCMEVAKNPSNNVETTPSMSKDCLEKLKNELEQDAQASQDAVARMGIFAGFNPFTSLLVINEILSKAQADEINREIIEATAKISEQISYVERSSNNLQKIARQMIVESDYVGASDSYVDKSVANALADRIKRESLAKEIASNKDVSLEGVFKAKFSDLNINLDDIKNVESAKSSLEKLNRYREELYEKAINKISIGESAKSIKKEIERVSRLITTTQKKILYDNETLEKIVNTKLRNSGIDLDNDIKMKIKKDGLSTDVINRILQKIPDIDKKGEILISLETISNTQNLLKEGKNINIPRSDKSANIATYIAYLKDADKDLTDKISSSNRQFVTVDTSGSKGYIQTGKDLDGYVLYQLNKESKNIINGKEPNYERLEKLKQLNIESNTNILSKNSREYIANKNKTIESINKERLRSVQQKRRESTYLRR